VTPAQHRMVWVDASGCAVHPDDPDQLVRVAIGSFGDKHSIWGEDPTPAPWLSEQLFVDATSAIVADTPAGPEVIAELLDRTERAFAGFAAPPSAIPITVPLAHAGIFDPGISRLGLSGGRNSMKSWSVVAWALSELANHRVNIVFAREFQSSIKESSYRAVTERIEQLGLEGFRVQRDRIIGPLGGEISFIGLDRNPDNVRSMENIRAFIVEEAHRISQNSIRILEPTLRKPGARAIYVWNRVSESDPVDQMFYGHSATRPVVHTTWIENPFISPQSILDATQDLERDPITARHVWDGEPLIRTDARVFPDTSFSIADIDDQLPDHIIGRWGADWGFAADPTVLVRVFVFGRTLYIRDEAYAIGLGMDEVPALFAGSDSRDPPRWSNPRGMPGIRGALHARIYADSAGPAYIRFLRDRGFSGIRKCKKGPGSVENGIAKMKSFDIVVHPSCVHALDELRTHRYRMDPKTEEILAEFVDDQNHVIDAVRYAIEKVR